MEYKFTDIFDIPKLTELCERFTCINGTVTALLDLEGNVHVKTGWQKICTEFHRVNPKSAARCLESDTAIAGQIAKGEKYNVYKCKNGLVDIAVPIFVDGDHVATFFTGQFLFQQPDDHYFLKQAQELGMEQIPYMDALRAVPVFDEEEVRKIMLFLTTLAQTIGEMGKARLELLRLHEHELQQKLALEETAKELTRAKNALEKLATEDHLTGLFNRRFFEQELAREFLRAKRYASHLVVCVLDADNFKSINDSWGHAAGDQVLKRIASIITDSIRKTDTAARIGGDEFCIIFPDANLEEISVYLENVRERISSQPILVNGMVIYGSCSFGLAVIHPEDTSESAILHRADQALYQSKHAGRDRITAAS